MTESAVYLQPAFILQQRKYRETSLIIDVLTRDFGRISLLAKGVRKAKSKTAGMLQPFIPLLISYFGKAELKTLTDVDVSSVPYRLAAYTPSLEIAKPVPYRPVAYTPSLEIPPSYPQYTHPE